jgi:hypothetical protein
MEIKDDDEDEVQLVDRTLIVRPIAEREREIHVANAIDRIVTRRRGLMTRLAEGAGEH